MGTTCAEGKALFNAHEVYSALFCENASVGRMIVGLN